MRRSYTAQRILIYFGGVGLLGSYNLSPQNPYRTFSHNAVHVLPASVHDRHAAQTRYLSAQLHQQRTRLFALFSGLLMASLLFAACGSNATSSNGKTVITVAFQQFGIEQFL